MERTRYAPASEPATPALTATDVRWRYRGGRELFHGASLSLQPGQLARVTGGNGRGKSTLLALLAGCCRPQHGSVRHAGYVGYLPQDVRQLPALSTRRLRAALVGTPRSNDHVVLQHEASRADQLSGGTARRLLLEAVLDLDACLFVLDEPTAGLDGRAVQDLTRTLIDRLAAGSAIVLADHGDLSDSLPADVDIELGGDPDRSSSVRIDLRGVGTFRDRDARSGHISLRVPAGDADAALLEALQAGWSVVRVVPPSADGR